MNIIVAISADRVIGVKNQLPWRIKEDMEFFKQQTTGKTVVMGRNTWESIPERFRPLPNRKNIVVTSRPLESFDNKPGASVDVVMNSNGFDINDPEVYCIGGAQLYKALLPHTKTMYVTHVHRIIATKENYTDCVRMPLWEGSFVPEERILQRPEFEIIRYERIGS
jgi:dihydrofolate reductase